MGIGRQLVGMGAIRAAVTTVRYVNRSINGDPFGLEEKLWRRWYDTVLRLSKYMSKEFSFQNYGYLCSDNSFDSDDETYCAGLYDHLIRGSSLEDLSGMDLLDVGCGKGGGCAYVVQNFHPRSMLGLDISGEAVEYCKEHHAHIDSLDFVRGESTDLPFPDGSFDVVTNVESSNHYSDCPKYFSEASRVLKPGGAFLFTDWRPREHLPRLREQISNRFNVIMESDITAEVVNALDADSERRQRLVSESDSLRKYGRWVQRVLVNFAGAKGSRRYREFASGALVYVSCWAEKK